MKPAAPEPVTWSTRLRLLMDACGWSQAMAAEKLGFAGPVAVARILKGGRPKPIVVLALARLEEAYAGEIEDWRDGVVGYLAPRRGGHTPRFDFRVKEVRVADVRFDADAEARERPGFHGDAGSVDPSVPPLANVAPAANGDWLRGYSDRRGRPPGLVRGVEKGRDHRAEDR